MSINQLRDHFEARPFVPFKVFVADGRSFDVPHEDFISLSPFGRTVIVYSGGDGHIMLDVLMITGIEIEPSHESVS